MKNYKNKNKMPKFHDIVDNAAAQISNVSVGEVWITNLDFKNSYSKLALHNFTSIFCNSSLVGGHITGT